MGADVRGWEVEGEKKRGGEMAVLTQSAKEAAEDSPLETISKAFSTDSKREAGHFCCVRCYY